jgi:hypothetical protein
MNATGLQAKVYRTVLTLGRMATFHVLTTPGTYDPATGAKSAATVTQVQALCSPPLEYQKSLRAESPIRQAATSLVLPAYGLTFSPQLVQAVTIGVDNWRVLEVVEHSVQSTIIAWELRLQKGAAA